MDTRSYVVTGASTGIGRACVDTLVDAGARVWATVRSDADEAALRAAHPDAVQVLRMDVTDEASVAAAGERVCAEGPLHGLVNNAGTALPGPLEYLPLETFRRQLEINVSGQLAVTQAMLPALRRARERDQPARIVMVGSIAGRIAGPMLGAYHASKFALAGLSDALRAELAPWSIPVILVEPGAIATPIWERGRASGDALLEQLPDEAAERYAAQIAAARANAERSARRGAPPERAAKVIVDALTARNPRPRRLVGTDAVIASIVARLPFRLRYRLTAARS